MPLRTLLLSIGVTVVCAVVGTAFGRALLAFFAGVGMLNADADPLDDDAAVSRPSAVELARPAVPALAVGGSGSARDPVIGTDQATADRHARLRAFQQREAEIFAARRFM